MKALHCVYVYVYVHIRQKLTTYWVIVQPYLIIQRLIEEWHTFNWALYSAKIALLILLLLQLLKSEQGKISVK